MKTSDGVGVSLQVRAHRNAVRLRFAITDNKPPVAVIPDVRPYVN
ncbi:hypothetical protein [Chryseobacterium sp. StRB126]|nr:hypothetical protein [Chryseobacterium sp. StRB126]